LRFFSDKQRTTYPIEEELQLDERRERLSISTGIIRTE